MFCPFVDQSNCLTVVSNNTTEVFVHCGSPFDPNKTEVIEIVILTLCVLVGGPINVYALHKTIRTYRKQPSNRGRLLLLKINLNVADLMIILVHGATHAIWIFATFVWHFQGPIVSMYSTYGDC